MDKKDFIFPGVILALVVIIAIGLLITHSDRPGATVVSDFATSTAAVATSSVSAGSSSTISATKPTSGASVPSGTKNYPYGSVTLSLGQGATFSDGLTIRPMHVLEDSRCPIGVMCIQAGTVRLSLNVTNHGKLTTQTATLGKSIQLDTETIAFDMVTPEHSKDGYPASGSYRFTFKVTPKSIPSSGCFVGGCSNELCSDTPNAVSNCLYTASYACYKNATCERQSNGSCGWTQTPALTSCLANPPK